ncbi:MAG: hypothetical protein EOP11_07775 [Proteobacteria bacterium]|nr:MAG: hypothetical protein EOP11_07775 [Pseudomonadota bacterium]
MLQLPPGCEISCPGCAYRGLSAVASAERKQSYLSRELAPWEAVIEPLREPAERWGYRKKSLLHVRKLGGEESSFWGIGMIRRRGREEEFIPIPDCPAHDGRVNELFSLAARLVPVHWPFSFALASGRALTIVLKSTRRAEWAAEMRAWVLPPEISLFVNWNPGAGNRPLDSRRTECLQGSPWLEEGGVRHGPVAFRQQIPELERAAVELGENFLEAAGLPLGVDLYCGLGLSLRRWRALGWEAAGVELSGESLAAAAVNAPGALLLRGRTEERLPQLNEFIGGKSFVLYTNPPREGHGAAVNGWINSAAPARVAYLSCNPRSLKDDLKVLAERYSVEKIVPFDFFPQTPHVEAMALLKLRVDLGAL